MTHRFLNRTVHSHKPQHGHAPEPGYFRVPKLTPTALEAILAGDDAAASLRTAAAAPAPAAQASPSAGALEARAHMARGWQLLQAQASR